MKKALNLNFKQIATFTEDLRQTYPALKTKLIKRRGFYSSKTAEKKKEHKEDAVFTETGDDDVEFKGRGRGSASYYSCEQYSAFHFF